MAVEKVQGISRLEQLCEELSEEERAKELKQEKKRQKRKNRRKNKCGFDMSEQEAKGYQEKGLGEVRGGVLSFWNFSFLCCPLSLTVFILLLQDLEDSVNTGCKSCGNREESGEGGESFVPVEGSSCSCPATTILGSPKIKNGITRCPYCIYLFTYFFSSYISDGVCVL